MVNPTYLLYSLKDRKVSLADKYHIELIKDYITTLTDDLKHNDIAEITYTPNDIDTYSISRTMNNDIFIVRKNLQSESSSESSDDIHLFILSDVSLDEFVNPFDDIPKSLEIKANNNNDIVLHSGDQTISLGFYRRMTMDPF